MLASCTTFTLTNDFNIASLREAYLDLSGADIFLDGSDEAFHHFLEIVKPSDPLHKGSYIFRQGNDFDDLILVRVGCVKCSRVDKNGDEEVLDFCLSGDIADINSLYARIHGVSAITLNTVMLYRIPLDGAQKIIRGLPMQLLRLMSQSLERSQVRSLKHSADHKMAAFIGNFGQRLYNRGFSKTQYRLPMTRYDISRHLGITPETVSRVLTRFQDMDAIRVAHHEIEILNRDQLARLSGQQA